MRNFQDPTMNFDYSRGNQFQLCPSRPQVFNNINAQYQPIIPYQEYYHPSNGSNQVVNGRPSTQTNVSDSSVTLNASNPTFSMNDGNQPVIGFFPHKQMTSYHQILKLCCLHRKNNMNFQSPSHLIGLYYHQAFFLHLYRLNTLYYHI
jgi:hypothetical protein